MNYAYIRVSTDRLTVENKRFEICQFCQREQLNIDGWIEETISGTKAYDKRSLGRLLKRVRKGDVIICSELSRNSTYKLDAQEKQITSMLENGQTMCSIARELGISRSTLNRWLQQRGMIYCLPQS